MSSIVYKAAPEETDFKIDNLEHSAKFIGQNVKELTVDVQSFGTVLIVDADSLETIHVKNPGLVLTFYKFPEKPVHIRGQIEEIRIHEGKRQFSLHRYASIPTLPLDEINDVAIVRNSSDIIDDVDALIIFPDNEPDLEIHGSFYNILVVGSDNLETLSIKGGGVIRSLKIVQAKSLKSLTVNKRVLSCEVKFCRNLETVTGFGDKLIFKPKQRCISDVSIGGFWHEVPVWYDSQVTKLEVKHFNADLTTDEIQSCSDLGGVKIIPHSYEGPGGLCEFSEALGLDFDDLSIGIEVPELVKLISSKPETFSVFINWCYNQLTHFQQYIAMRILASLITQDFDKGMIIRTRDKILQVNLNMPKILTQSVNDGFFGGKWNPIYYPEDNGWETPPNSVMPFGRLDLEIWLNSNEGIEFLTKDLPLQNTQYGRYGRRMLGRSNFVRSLIVSTLSAANRGGRKPSAESKLNSLVEMLYTNPVINTDPYCCEFTILHLGVSKVVNNRILGELIKGILSMNTDAWVKAALLVGIVDQTDSARARLALKQIASDKEFNVSESNAINAISIAGRRAFESGKVARPEWPYVRNWNFKGRV